MPQVKVGDVLWVMIGTKQGERTIWQAESKAVVKVDRERNNIFWLDNGWGASQNSLGRSYFRTRKEAEKHFEKGKYATPLGNGKYESHEGKFKRPTHISCGKNGCRIG